jgi:hypothetical protein
MIYGSAPNFRFINLGQPFLRVDLNFEFIFEFIKLNFLH